MSVSKAGLVKRLKALDCPFASNVNIDDSLSLQRVVCFLEDAVIRRQPIELRDPLYCHPFLPALRDYLRLLVVPFPLPLRESDVPECVQFLVRLALQLHYEDNHGQYNIPIDPWKGRCIPVVEGSAASHELAAEIGKLRRILTVDGPEASVTDAAKAAADVVCERLATVNVKDGADGKGATAMEVDSEDENEDENMNDNKSTQEQPQRLQIDDVPLGFHVSDEQVDRVCRILRVLYVRKLRRLQNSINTCVAQMQGLTADPKTDSKLGKVGK